MFERLFEMRATVEGVVDRGHVLESQSCATHAAAEACLVKGLVVGTNKLHRVDCLGAHRALGVGRCGGGQ